jgi:CNT family concentrative nucleoside transporter
MNFILAAPDLARGTLPERLQSFLGLIVFALIAFGIGRLRGAKVIPWRIILWGFVLQFAFGATVLYWPNMLAAVQQVIQKLLDFSNAGAELIFGNLTKYVQPVVDDSGKQVGTVKFAAVFAFSVLPTIIFISMLTAILYHLGILTAVVHSLAWVMQKTMKASGAEALSTAANIFVGQTEAPLLVRPFLAAATRSELMVVMVGGFANIASGVLVVYADLLKDALANAGGHLAAACFISAPATLVIAKLMMPETEQPITAGGVPFKVEKHDANLIDAATRGVTEGLHLALNVGAMLIAFTALMALLNALLVWITSSLHLGATWEFYTPYGRGTTTYSGYKLEDLLGWLLAPLAWLTGIEWQYCGKVGSLLGVKTVLNEFIAYFNMSNEFKSDPNYLSPRATLLATYALCGFANFASVGIQIGGISVMAPTRRADLSRLGLLAMFGGALASMMGACVVGVLM